MLNDCALVVLVHGKAVAAMPARNLPNELLVPAEGINVLDAVNTCK